MPNDTTAATEELLALLSDQGYQIEEIGTAADDGTIVNLHRDGRYALTLTVTRTPGY